VALTKSGQVSLAAAVHVMADAARLAVVALAEAARGAGLAFGGRISPAGSLPWVGLLMVILSLSARCSH
jgi:hypothetical protein